MQIQPLFDSVSIKRLLRNLEDQLRIAWSFTFIGVTLSLVCAITWRERKFNWWGCLTKLGPAQLTVTCFSISLEPMNRFSLFVVLRLSFQFQPPSTSWQTVIFGNSCHVANNTFIIFFVFFSSAENRGYAAEAGDVIPKLWAGHVQTHEVSW